LKATPYRKRCGNGAFGKINFHNEVRHARRHPGLDLILKERSDYKNGSTLVVTTRDPRNNKCDMDCGLPQGYFLFLSPFGRKNMVAVCNDGRTKETNLKKKRGALDKIFSS